jgi:Fe-S-cluster-containing dehydrogenase component
MDTCPQGAITKKTDGTTWVEWETCIGCGACLESCKYNVIKIAENNALICDLCEGNPECVDRCPTNALEFLETVESTETYLHAFKRLKELWNFE